MNGLRKAKAVVALPLVFDGEPAVVAIGRSVSERKRMAERMLLMDRMAAVGTLAAGVADDINTPIQFASDSVRYGARHPAASLAVSR